MKVIKTFETSLDINDVEKIYQPIKTIILDEIKTKYEKKCFKSSYIIEIKEIIHYSECEISTEHQQCIVLLDVIFTALVEIYNIGDIIPLCTLEIKRSNGEFIAESNDSKIQLIANENDKILPAFKVGDKFPIQVQNAIYSPHQDKISIIGSLPEIKPSKLIIYKVIEKISIKQLNAIKQFIKTIDEINSWINNLDSATSKKFNEYIAVTYPYKENKNSTLDKISIFNFTNIDELDKLNESKEELYICYPPEISRSKSTAFILTNKYKSDAIEENLMTIISDWITDHYNYIYLIQALTENYPSPTFDRYKALWGLIHLRKEN